MPVFAPVRTMSIKVEERESFLLHRRRLGFTQSDVASRSGVGRIKIVNWENGSALLKPDQIESLWAALEADVEDGVA